MKHLTLAMTFLLASTTVHSTGEAQYRQLEQITSWVVDLFPLQHPSTESEIVSLGNPIQIIDLGQEMGHDGSPVNLRKFVFDGLTISALISADPDRAAYVYSIQVMSPEWVLSDDVTVGMPASELQHLPFPANNGPYGYCGEADNCVEFDVKDGRIRAVRISLYTG